MLIVLINNVGCRRIRYAVCLPKSSKLVSYSVGDGSRDQNIPPQKGNIGIKIQSSGKLLIIDPLRTSLV